MKVTGIIAEYNPFHNGHKYHIEKTKQQTDSFVVAIMSGSLVQRGEFAAFSKHARAKSALLNGADLVIELPALYSSASAQRFALGAVKILDALNVVDYLSFGSECGDINELVSVSEMLEKLDNSPAFSNALKTGASFPSARQSALNELLNKPTDIFSNPNDTLGIEYLSAIKSISSDIKPLAIKREGVNHDSNTTNNRFASASFIREKIKSSNDIFDFIPENTKAIISEEIKSHKYKIDYNKFETATLYALKQLSKEDFSMLPDVSEGLENRLYTSAQTALSLDEFFSSVKTKRYTLARLRRIAIFSLMGITKEDYRLSPAYIRILGMNNNGKKILSKAKENSTLPFYTAFSKIEKIGGRLAEIDRKATDLHSFLSLSPLPCGQDFLENAVMI